MIIPIVALIVGFVLLGGLGAGIYFIFRNRVPRNALIALVIGVPIAIVVVGLLLLLAIVVLLRLL